jgi:hypothetical protein
MNMNIESRIHLLIQQLRRGRRSLVVPAFLSSLAAILLFLGGSYFFLFSYYESLHRAYYGSVLRDLSSFQSRLIGRGTYREDMRTIARILRRHRGVQQVWFTDRYGKLIYHTDNTVLADYRARRMPSEYFESIEHAWEFEDGYPIMNMVETDSWTVLRVSLPLYVTGLEEHDFIVGMDVRRFLFVPARPLYVALFAAAYLIVAVALMVLPLTLWTRSKIRNAELQARMVTESILAEAASRMKETAAVPAPGKQETTGGAQVPPLETQSPPPETRQPPAQEVQKEEKPAPAAAPKPMSAEIDLDRKLMTFLKEKRTLFGEQSIDLEFVQAQSYAFQSKGAEGVYILYHKTGGSHLYACFNTPDVEQPRLFDVLGEIAAGIRKALKTTATAADLLKSCNDYCRRHHLIFSVALVVVKESDRSVEYGVSGAGSALYLKDGESSVKVLTLENPELGALTKAEFTSQISTAEIRLSKNEIFTLTPFNASEFMIGSENLDGLLRRAMVQQRNLAPSLIGRDVVELYDGLDLELKNSLPQTGFAVLKFQ